MRVVLGRAVVLSALVFGAACGEGDEAATPTPTLAEAAAPAVTWHEHIQPLVSRACVRCHSEVGVAPSDLSTYESARSMASVMAAYVEAGLMPPPASDPSCQPYHDSERMFLSDEDRALVSQWAELGAPEGDPAAAPPTPSWVDRIEDTNLNLQIAEDYTPRFGAQGNDYACFVLKADKAAPYYIQAIQADIQEARLVHHLFLFLDKDGNAESRYGDRPFPCLSSEANPELDDVWDDWKLVSSWAPGGTPLDFGEGAGLLVEPGQSFVLQMHYFRSGPEADFLSDRSGYALRTVDSVEREIFYTGVGDGNFRIPAGEKSHTYHYDWTLPERSRPEYDIFIVSPHMHVLGTAARAWIDHVDGSTSCMYDGGFDFDNQQFYPFIKPVHWAPGDVINMDCTWDNSAGNPNQMHSPPRDITYGEGTDDEMCFLAMYYYQTNPDVGVLD